MSLNITQINVGDQPNDGSGLPLRDAFQLVNSNFASIETVISSGDFGAISANVLTASNGITTTDLEVTGAANINSLTATSAFIGTITASAVTADVTGNLAGVATRATRLETPRLINGAPFDGTADITVSIDNYTIDGGGF